MTITSSLSLRQKTYGRDGTFPGQGEIKRGGKERGKMLKMYERGGGRGRGDENFSTGGKGQSPHLLVGGGGGKNE